MSTDEVTVPPAATVTVRFWAGAKRAAGHAEEQLDAADVGGLRELLAARPVLREVMQAAAVLVDGAPATDTTPLRAGATVDILPPFAGG